MHRVNAWTARVAPALLVAALVTTLTSTGAQAAPPSTGPGSLRTTFAADGSWNGGFNADEALDSVVVQPDGKIVAAFYDASGGITTVRLLPDGTPDPGWNDNESDIWSSAEPPGDSAARRDRSGLERAHVRHLCGRRPGAVPREGTVQQIAILRLTADGHDDASWGTGGVSPSGFGVTSTTTAPRSRSTQPRTGCMSGPGRGNDGSTDFAVIALDVNTGALDTAFSGDGVADHGLQRPRRHRPGHRHRSRRRRGGCRLTSRTSAGARRRGRVADQQRRQPRRHLRERRQRQGEFELASGGNSGARSVAVDGLGYFYLGLRVEGLALPGGVRGGVLRLDTTGHRQRLRSPQHTPAIGSALHDFGRANDNAGVAVDSAGRALVVGSAGGPRSRASLPTATRGHDVQRHRPRDPGLRLGGAGAAGGSRPPGTSSSSRVCPNFDGGGNPIVWRSTAATRCRSRPSRWPTRRGAQYANLHATGITVNGVGRVRHRRPGLALTLGFTYKFDNPVPMTSAAACASPRCSPASRMQGQSSASRQAAPSSPAATAPSAAASRAPSRPGRYYIGFGRIYENACSAGAGNWTADGKPWNGNLVPTPAAFLAEVVVLDGGRRADRDPGPGHRAVRPRMSR